MIKKLKSLLLSVTALTFVAAPALMAAAAPTASAVNNTVNIVGSTCSGTNFDLNGTSGCPATGTSKLQDLLAQIINIFSIVVGVIAVVMIIVGGLRYITSGGESGKVSGAKNTIMYALIGLVVVALAQLLVHFVLNQSSQIASGG